MRRIFFLILLYVISIPISISTAQNGCDIELADTLSYLAQAQEAVDTGNNLTAVSLLFSVQNEIETLISGCDVLRLSEKYTAPDDSLAFFYPAGWQVQIITEGAYLVTSSPGIMDQIVTDLPENLALDEVAIALQLIPLGDLDFDAVVDQLRTGIESQYQALGGIDDSTIDGRRYISLNIVVNENVSGRMSLADYSDAETPSVIVVFGLVNSANLPLGERLTDALQQSVQVPPVESLRNPGVSLGTLSYSEATVVSQQADVRGGFNATLSPDGSMLAWESPEGLCIREGDQASDCTATPERYSGPSPLLQWSPDGRYIAFQEDFVRRFAEPDVWLFDVAQQTFVDLTDDGKEQRGFKAIEENAWLDSVMTWGPDNQIYLLRITVNASGDLTTSPYTLLRVDPDTGETTQIQDLTDFFETKPPVSYQDNYSLEGTMAVSSDATQMVISVTGIRPNAPENGIWLIDLSGVEAPQQVASSRQFVTGYNKDVYAGDNFRFIESIAWDADGTGLYVYAISGRDSAYPMIYHMTLANGDIIPLVDLSSYSNADLSPSLWMPYAPVMAPDYQGVIFASTSQDRSRISAVSLDGQSDEPVILYQGDSMNLQAGNISMMASDGTLLMRGALLRPD